jgi:hypothetical protein
MDPVQPGFAGAIASSSGSQLYKTVGSGGSAVNVFYRPSACFPRAALETRSQATQTEDLYIASGIRRPDQPPIFDSFPPDVSMDGAYGLETPAGCNRLNVPSLAQAYAASQQSISGEQLLRRYQRMWEQLQCALLIPLTRVLPVFTVSSSRQEIRTDNAADAQTESFLSLTDMSSSSRGSVNDSPDNDKV